ncbi:MAG TPA: TetR/AcrR family transcriptional regulator [Acidimicrobiales bacterium]|jgi:AcrR family transcriptional regulator|nr:TetR/AcrR family transcriptional regulator [Acidimicrobiales bacterium]
MRADAVKNRARILQAAEEVFSANGLSAPIDLVAEQAGVGVGTVYRHFPTKEALFEAIVLTGLQELVAAAAAPADGEDAGDAFYAFIRTFASKVSIKHDLIDALSAAGIDIKSQCAMTVEDLESGVDLMIRRAEAAGAVRPGVTTQEVIGLVVGVCKAVDMSSAEDASRDRMLDIVCDGLRVPSPT